MCCEHLLCAACGGPVAEARCATCVVSRAHVHGGGGRSWSPELLAAVVLAVLLVSLLLG